MYTTIQEKLRKLTFGSPLPLDMLREQVAAFPELRYFSRPPSQDNSNKPKKADPSNDGSQLALVINKVHKFLFEKWTLVFTQDDPHKLLQAQIRIEFQDGSKGWFQLSSASFFRLEGMADVYKTKEFRLLKPGKLAYVAEDTITCLTGHNLIFQDVDSHMRDGVELYEGEPVMVLQTLLLDTVPLVKILHGETIGWTYGMLYDQEYFDQHDNENHWL